MSRLARHLLLFAASALVGLAFYAGHPSPDVLWRLSMGSAYASLALLALSLAIGPWNRLRRLPNPVSSYLRRDVGIWAGILGVFHVVVGLQVHMSGKMLLYFLPPPDARYAFPVRIDLFGIASWVGLFATLVLAMLLVLSNDASLKKLGRDRWKALQRWNYAGAVLVLLHGALYMALEKRTWPFVGAAIVVVLVAAAMQLAGYRAATKRA
jgi:sulfoxide reductase heme-binding subunit YedZ